jgi:hypothetical protein
LSHCSQDSNEHTNIDMLFYGLVVTGFFSAMLMMFGAQKIKAVWLLHLFEQEKKSRKCFTLKERRTKKNFERNREEVEVVDGWFSDIDFIGEKFLVTIERFLCLIITYLRVKKFFFHME